MTTIETFCRVCAEPVDIQVEDGADPEVAAAMARLGVTCDECFAPRFKARPIRAKTTGNIRPTHNDP